MADERESGEARAKRLREEIKGLVNRKKGTAEAESCDSSAEKKQAESPREFIHRRMQEEQAKAREQEAAEKKGRRSGRS